MPDTFITVSATFEAQDGVKRDYTEQYVRHEAEGPRTTYWVIHNGKASGFGYSGPASDAAFKATRVAAFQEMAEDACRARLADRERVRLGVYFDDRFKAILAGALDGLSNDRDIIAACKQACIWHGLSEPLDALVRKSTKKQIRDALKSAYATARANVREEYPDEYREQGADDFYEGHEDDIAEALAQEI